MMDDISRRGFLKGIMAAAAVPIVAPLLPPEPLIEAPPVAHAPSIEIGELWMRQIRSDAFRLVGMLRSSMLRRDLIETTDLRSPWPSFQVGPEIYLDVSTVLDNDGRDAVFETMWDRRPVELLMGAGSFDYQVERAFLISAESSTVSAAGLVGWEQQLSFALDQKSISMQA